MGALIVLDCKGCDKCEPFASIPSAIFLSLVFNTLILVFGGLITLEKPEIEFNNKVTFLFGKYFVQFGVIFSIFLSGTLIISFISLISGKNCFNSLLKYLRKYKFFSVKYFNSFLLISLIDILIYLVIYRLITPYSTIYSITEYFTEAIYLLILIIYYKIFEKAHFYLKQILISYVFFTSGIFLMIFGLSKYFCKSKYVKKEAYGYKIIKYYCIEGTNNYFYNYHYSILISIIVLPFLFFIKMFMAKKYMEVTEINAFILTVKKYFMQLIISSIIFLIVEKGKINKQNFPFNLAYSILYYLASESEEFLFLIYLQKTSLFYIFILLVFRKLDFHLLAGFNGKGNYFLFLIGPILTNILGLITFSYQGNRQLNNIINGPLIKKKANEINDDLLNQKVTKINNEPDSFYSKNVSDLNDVIKDKNSINNFDKEGDTPSFVENNKEKKDELQEYKNKILNLESQINFLNIKVRTLQVKNQNLEDTNEKLSEKIAILCEKYNINEDEDELVFVNPKN